jgi:hypothetical protein
MVSDTRAVRLVPLPSLPPGEQGHRRGSKGRLYPDPVGNYVADRTKCTVHPEQADAIPSG